MKKNRLLTIVVLVLAGVAGWLIFSKRDGTIGKELRDFAVKDTGAVTKIFLADKKGNQILLEKQPDGSWIFNGNELARADGVRLLLATMHDLEVRSPVAKAAYNNIIRNIAATGVKVEIYAGQEKVKTYYVGSATQDMYGTFMYLENSSAPFIIHIPGFNGYLTPRYIVKAEDWKAKSIFRLVPSNLKSISVIDRQQPGFAFTISASGDQAFALSDPSGNLIPNASHDKIVNYLQYFESLNYEFPENTLSDAQKDSLLATPPFRTIVLDEKSGKHTRVDLWRRPVTPGNSRKLNLDGKEYAFDIDRMVGTLNQDSTLLVIQYFSFDKLFRSPADFLGSRP